MKNYFLLLVFTLFFSAKLFSQAKPIEQVSFDRFTTETQYSSDNMDFVEMIWWLPTEFWKIIYSHDPSIGQDEIDEIVSLVDNYVIAIVIKGKIGMFGGVNYQSYEDLKSHVQVKYNNELLKIVDHGNLNSDLQNLLSIMKPIMANMLGNMGQNLHFFVFDNPDNKKVLPVKPISNDYLLFSMDGFSADADLPIASLLLEKICPEDKAELNGKWNYCPFHGKKLISQ
jgi:hypothetical protein